MAANSYVFVARTNTAATATTVAVTNPASIPAGALVVVTIAKDGTGTPSSVVDSAGNTYSLAIASATTKYVAIYYCVLTTALPATGTITATFATTTNRSMDARYCLTPASGTPLDGTQTVGASTGTALSVATKTPSTANSLIVAAQVDAGTTGTTPKAGWFEDSDVVVTSATNHFETASKIQIAAAAEVGGGTLATSKAWQQVQAVFSLATPTFTPSPSRDTFNSGASTLIRARTGFATSAFHASDADFITDAAPTYAKPNTTGICSMVWNTSFAADQNAWFVYKVVDSFLIYLRCPTATSATDGYDARIGFGGDVSIERNGGTVLVTATLTAPAIGDTYAFEATGAQLTVWKKPVSTGVWGPIQTIHDAGLTGAGFVAFLAPATNSVEVDEIGAGVPSLNVTDAGTCTFGIATSGTSGIDAGTTTIGITTSGVAAVTGSGPAQYGMPWNADALNNREIGLQTGRRVAIQFKAEFTDTLAKVAFALAYGTGYSAGTGGSVKCDVQSDDGTGSHNPSGTSLASATLTTPNGTPDTESMVEFTFGTPPSLVAGTIYHIVLTQQDASPTVNWVSIDGTYNTTPGSPIQPGFPNDDDYRMKYWYSTSSPGWIQDDNTSASPFNLHYSSAGDQGWAVDYTPVVAALRNVGGVNRVRLNFTPSLTISPSKMWTRLYRLSGTTQALTIALKDSAGTTIASGTIAAASIIALASGASPADGTWVGVALTGVTLNGGSQYFLELSSPSETVFYRAYPMRTAETGNWSDKAVTNRFDDGHWEWSTNSGSTYSLESSDTGYKMQAYFDVPGSQPSDAETTSFAIVASGHEAIADGGTCTFGVVAGGADGIGDTGLGLIAISNGEFPTTPALDDYNTGANQAVTARAGMGAGVIWTGDTTLTTDAVPTKAVPLSSAFSDNYFNTQLADDESWIVLAATQTGYLDVYARITALGSPTMYAVGIDASGNWYVTKYVAGVATVLVGPVAVGLLGLYEGLGIKVTGTQIRAYKRIASGMWQSIPALSTSDGSITGPGYFGYDVGGTTTTIDSAGGGTPVGTEKIGDAGTTTIVEVTSGSEAVSDAATTTIVEVTSAAANAIIDQGTCVFAVASSGQDVLGDQGTTTFQVTPSGSNNFADAGTTVVVVASGEADGIVDQGTCVIGLVTSGADGVGDAGSSTMTLVTGTALVTDSGIVTFAITVTELDAEADAATSAAVIVTGGAEAVSDAGTCIVTITASGADAISDQGTTTFDVAPGGVERISDGATTTLAIIASGTEVVGDAGSSTAVIVSGGADAVSDQGTSLVVIVPTGDTSQIPDLGTTTFQVATTGQEALSDAATSPAVILSSGVESVADAGTATFTIAPSGATASQSDAVTSTLAIVSSGVEAVADAGTCTFGIVGTGSEALADAGATTAAIVTSAAEALSDAGTSIATVTTPGADALSDQGSSSMVVAPGGHEALADSGTGLLGVLTGGSESVADAGSTSLVLAASGSEAVADAGSVTVVLQTDTAIVGDVGTVTFGIVTTRLDAVADAGIVTFAIGSSGTEQLADQGSAAITITPTPGDAIGDQGSSAVTIVSSGAEIVGDQGTTALQIAVGGLVTLADAGTVVLGIVGSINGEKVADAGTSIVGVATPGSDAVSDQGTSALSIAPSAGDGIGDAGSATVVIVPGVNTPDVGTATIALTTGGVEAIADAGTSTLGIASGSSEAIADEGDLVFSLGGDLQPTDDGLVGVVIISSGIESVADGGTCTISVTAAPAEGISDAGTCTIGLSSGASSATADGGSVAITFVAGGGDAIVDSGTTLITVTGRDNSPVEDGGTVTVKMMSGGFASGDFPPSYGASIIGTNSSEEDTHNANSSELRITQVAPV